MRTAGPKCQTLAKERWVEARQSEILAVPHSHLVFTLPHALSPLLQGNPRRLYGLLFKAVADTLTKFGRHPAGSAARSASPWYSTPGVRASASTSLSTLW